MARAVDTLFVACTRPAMKWGVPFDGFLANAVVTGSVTVFVVHSPPGFFLGIGIHFALRELCRVDAHFFGKWRLFFNTKARSRTGMVWGGSRIQPSPTRIHSVREVATSV